MCKDSNDTVAREPYLSTLVPLPAHAVHAHRRFPGPQGPADAERRGAAPLHGAHF